MGGPDGVRARDGRHRVRRRVGIALVALVLGLAFVVPIGVLVFMGAFIPVVGALISGIAAVAVALVTVGPVRR